MTNSNILAKTSIPFSDDMIRAGVQFGHKVAKKNPKMDRYVDSVRNDIQIFNIEKTEGKLKEAITAVQQIVPSGGLVLFVGTQIGRQQIGREAAISCGMPYVDTRWLGGTLTNFKTMLKRLEKFADLDKKMADGDYAHYTKKEQGNIKEELRKLNIKFGGFKAIRKVPSAIFLLSLKDDILAAREAKRIGVKVIAVADTDSEPSMADYLIPANDDALSSLTLIASTIASAINKAKEQKEPVENK
ncbi:MAG: 30S ribosomal protein S2 [Candidatus Portnoybacteria bacterium CG10_big_fil_rev_8_21_14_0_10_36_7]|uniref:Small ribosomal subunit protein uS2 n=1 Tax=Candidatus Portnoybacteria bacterium CG10_big_fil_rev_8_21_14_0_10_36_7 TaxID=1974812 RepID=A0A2M8KDQ4_9BACT|nr:MAG: 30S ribosomal protein S2 [Candidatus Portnoybacteria bacterium CG10_big_fil_rev_8_21_14_0_10_36_7]